MKSLLPLLLLLVGLQGARAETAEEAVTLEGPTRIEGLFLEDVTGDGVPDVTLIEGRTLYLYAGREKALPTPAPTRRIPLPADTNFVDAAPASLGRGPGFVVLGAKGLRHIGADGTKTTPLDAAGDLPAWQDSRKAAFVDIAGPDGSLRIPTETGWRILEPGAGKPIARHLDAPPDRYLEPTGTFLEDTTRIVTAHARLVRGGRLLGTSEDAPLPWWTLSGRQVLIFHGAKRVGLALPRRGREGVRHLVDIDGDGTPDLCRHRLTNRRGSYAFYRTVPPLFEDGTLRVRAFAEAKPTTRLELEGSQLDPHHVDLNGDGLLDFVVTTIPVNAANTVRALTGKVTAYTIAFVQREGQAFYAVTPDASIASNIGIAVRLSKKGRIDVRRSYTILVDADTDGDGRKDLIVRTKEAELTVHRGSPQSVWEAEGQVVPIPADAESTDIEGYRADLDADGRDEILLLYRGGPGAPDRLRLVEIP